MYDVVQRLKPFATTRLIPNDVKPQNSMASQGVSPNLTSAPISESKKKLINDIVEHIFKEINIEKHQKTNQRIHNLNNNDDVTLQDIYSYLLDGDQEEPNFIFLHGYFKYFGIEVNESKKEAFELFNTASKKDHILAQYYVGLCYETGSGTARNEKLSFEYYKKLADMNCALGQFKVGYFYHKGIGIKKNVGEALDWYEKAANNGNLIAMYNLSLMHKNGEGTEKNVDNAYYWCNKSVEQGNTDAQKFLEALKKIKNRKKRSDSYWVNLYNNVNNVFKKNRPMG
jgi:hypothetical protein